MLTATVDVTAAELKNLLAAPKQIVPAPGAGKAIALITGFINYLHVTTPYTVPSPGSLMIGAPATAIYAYQLFQAGGILDDTQNYLITAEDQPQGSLSADVTNAPLVLGFTGATDLTVGDGTARVTVGYIVVDILS